MRLIETWLADPERAFDLFAKFPAEETGFENPAAGMDREQFAAYVRGLRDESLGVGLPVGDDYLYEEFGIEKPADYNELKKRQEAGAAGIQKAKEKAATTGEREDEEEEIPETGKEAPKEKKNALKNAYNWLKRFFAKAPGKDGAALEW